MTSIGGFVLRDGSRTSDPRLDLIFDKDPRNRNHPTMAVAPEIWDKVDKEWPRSPVTDQGKEGACVGHGWTGWCAACDMLPHITTVPELDAYAFEAYHVIQHEDEWSGCHLGLQCPIQAHHEAYGGTSVKAGAEVLRSRNLLDSYTWTFGIEELLKALTTVGPAVLGVPWLDGMYEAPGGKVTLSGSKVGAHCIKADAVFWTRETIGWQNSWGLVYGDQGRAEISFTDMDWLLTNGGESCVALPAAVGALSQ